ncbi:hypothetical protein ACH5RR_032795 [Cinchona calisaya]|uniref:Uncharacterized protein n=1 Tax=Cinchona calisaya TaxID=153742 RepID=A0ABD2YK92_9GENT
MSLFIVLVKSPKRKYAILKEFYAERDKRCRTQYHKSVLDKNQESVEGISALALKAVPIPHEFIEKEMESMERIGIDTDTVSIPSSSNHTGATMAHFVDSEAFLVEPISDNKNDTAFAPNSCLFGQETTARDKGQSIYSELMRASVNLPFGENLQDIPSDNSNSRTSTVGKNDIPSSSNGSTFSKQNTIQK